MEIHAAARSEQQAVLDTVTLAFAADAPTRYWWPGATEYMHWWPRFVVAMGERAFDAQTLMVTPNFEGVAIWLPPGVHPDPAQVEALDMPSDEQSDRIAGDLRAAMNSFHPETPHWYLWTLAVDPRCQHLGVGSALMKHMLAIIDERHETAYLESSAPRNVPFYERHGFEVVGLIQVHDIPPITPMLRRPR